MFLLMICRSKKNFFFKELKFFEKDDHIFRNQRDSKIYSFYFDVKVNPITFSDPQQNLKRNYQPNLADSRALLIIYLNISA